MMTFMKKKCLLEVTITIIFLLALSPHAAADLDISGPIDPAHLRRDLIVTIPGGCQETSPDNVGLPPFVKLDLANSKLTATAGQKPGEIKESTIKSFQEIDIWKVVSSGHRSQRLERGHRQADGSHGRYPLPRRTKLIVFFGRCTTP